MVGRFAGLGVILLVRCVKVVFWTVEFHHTTTRQLPVTHKISFVASLYQPKDLSLYFSRCVVQVVEFYFMTPGRLDSVSCLFVCLFACLF